MPDPANAPHTFLLSVLMPAYNERETIQEAVQAVLQTPYNLELVIVDDGSTDGTCDILRSIQDERVKVHFHKENIGKGGALRTAMQKAGGDVLLIQDADTEYDPGDYPVLLAPILAGKADVVYGSRFAGHGAHRVLYFWHSVGNKFLTLLSNIFTNINLTDMETCYKAFTRQAIEGVVIEESRFGFEPEITAKLARKGLRIYEVPISYYGRTYEEGKKIGWRDGVKALWCILKYNLRPGS